jgi:hypothetical protein
MLTKNSKGLRATGTAAVSCARHELFRPLGVGDLQKGERFVVPIYLITTTTDQCIAIGNATWIIYLHPAS